MEMTERAPGGRLAFMGRMAAGLSHEIRNLEAVLREKAGLIEDLFMMGEQAGSADVARIRSLTKEFQEDLNRVEAVTRDLSFLAHLPEKGSTDVGGEDLLAFALHRSQRTARSRGIRIETQVEDRDVRLPAAPIDALAAIVSLLESTAATAERESSVRFIWQETPGEDRMALRIEGLSKGAMEPAAIEAFGPDTALEWAPDGRSLTLSWKGEGAGPPVESEE